MYLPAFPELPSLGQASRRYIQLSLLALFADNENALDALLQLHNEAINAALDIPESERRLAETALSNVQGMWAVRGFSPMYLARILSMLVHAYLPSNGGTLIFQISNR